MNEPIEEGAQSRRRASDEVTEESSQFRFPRHRPQTDTLDARRLRTLWDLGQVLAAVELVTEDDTVGCDLVLAREWVMGAPAGFENG